PGQDAVRIAQGFHDALGITGVILTKMDGDARGGAALSIYGVTRAPIKYVGTGEKPDALEPFHPDRMAGRILQQGDVLSLVEKAQAAVDEDEAKRLAKKAVSKRGLDLQDFLGAMRQMQKLGPLKNVLGMLPGVNPTMLKAAKVDDGRLKHIEAIVLSMTPAERADPDVMNGSRRMRVARGAGRTVQEVNQLLAQFKQMQKVMKVAGKPGGKLPGGGAPPGGGAAPQTARSQGRLRGLPPDRRAGRGVRRRPRSLGEERGRRAGRRPAGHRAEPAVPSPVAGGLRGAPAHRRSEAL